jgi:DNA-binding transcriptional MerR regulator
MTTLTIGELAQRSGVTTSALRYYEGIGLVTPTARTDSGYRVYDDQALERLAFIARAKQLGCSLEEVADLLIIWSTEPCAPVQRRLHTLVTAKLRGAEQRLAETSALATQLHHAADQLSAPPIDGPCADDCACNGGRAGVSRPLAAVAAPPDTGQPPFACTLDTAAIPGRRAEWQSILGHVDTRTRAHGGALRLEFSASVSPGDLAQLVSAEQQCCAFFSFTLTFDARGPALEVRVPDGCEDAISSLFGRAG